MKVLITGGAGFIGSHLTDRLLARGDDVLVIDNYATGRHDNLTPQAHLTIVEGTIADQDLVNNLFDNFKPEYVVHAAASYKDPENWAEDSRTNALGTANIVQASEKANVKRVFFFFNFSGFFLTRDGFRFLSQPLRFGRRFCGWFPGSF